MPAILVTPKLASTQIVPCMVAKFQTNHWLMVFCKLVFISGPVTQVVTKVIGGVTKTITLVKTPISTVPKVILYWAPSSTFVVVYSLL